MTFKKGAARSPAFQAGPASPQKGGRRLAGPGPGQAERELGLRPERPQTPPLFAETLNFGAHRAPKSAPPPYNFLRFRPPFKP